jgi:magnesium chelatase subunit I
LKDRIGSQILTHYPDDIETARKITEQESNLDSRQSDAVYVPDVAKDLLEQVCFEARDSEYVDAKSGVSARTSITAFENLLSTAERRALLSGADKTTLRLSDFLGVIPAITGKIELVYEGEQEGADGVAAILIDDAVKSLFSEFFPEINKLERKDEETPYDELLSWFFQQPEAFELLDDFTDAEYKRSLDSIPELNEIMREFQPDFPKKDSYFLKELLLWGLVSFKKLSKQRFAEGYQFKDLYGSFISGL